MKLRNLDRDLLKLYQASHIRELCDALTNLMATHVPHRAILILFRPQSFRLDVYARPKSFEEPARNYVQSGYRHDLWLRNSPVHPRVVAVRHSDYTPISVLKRSAFYKRILKPVNSMYAVSVVAWQSKEWMAMATLHRSPAEGDFTDTEMDLLRRIQPHFSSVIRRIASENEERLRRRSVEAFVELFPSAFVLLNFDLQIVQINKSGRKYCHEMAAGPLRAHINKPERIPELPPLMIEALGKMRDRIRRIKPGRENSSSQRTLIIEALNCRVTYIPERLARGMHEGLFLVVFNSSAKKRQPPEFSLLSPREKEVAYAVGTGKTNGEIAAMLGKSQATVRHQLSSILKKLDLENRYGILLLFGNRL